MLAPRPAWRPEVYAWIWRRLPFGLRGKLGASAFIVVAIAALLWFVVFPIIEPIMPFNDGQITDTNQSPASSRPVTSGAPSVSGGAVSISPSRLNR